MTGSQLTQLVRLVRSKFDNFFFFFLWRKDQCCLYKETAKLEIREFKTPGGTNFIQTKAVFVLGENHFQKCFSGNDAV